MDSQDSTTKSDTLFDKRMEAMALPLSLLRHITDDFSDNHEIGRGGFAVVYKGLLENGVVAVKKLSEVSDIDERKFHGEVDCLMKAKHKNIVRFLGYCSDTQGQWIEHNGKSVMADVRHRLLCFEYLPNGSLDKYINDSSREWGKCYQIIKGVCEGLHYLHKERQIVHSDLKPANILLDNDMVPKITDFGISRCFDGKKTHFVTTKILGSMGYLSPEAFRGIISFKSDIFSLGVIIIEVLTATKDDRDVEDVLKYWGHKVEKAQKEHQLEQIRVCTKVAQRCMNYYPAERPSAEEIIKILKQTEREELCIETVASSSTAPQASSLVESKNKPSLRILHQHMATMIDSVVGSFIKKLQDIILEEAISVLGVKGDLKEVQRTMNHIQYFLNDAEQRITEESAVNNWLGELKDAMYEADDIIDLARLEGNKLLADHASSSRSSAECSRFPVLTGLPTIQRPHEIAIRIRKFNTELDKLGERFLKLQNVQPRAEVSVVHRMENRDLVEPILTGKETFFACRRLVELILEHKEEKTYKIGIVGTGGVGKTTLAQKIYNDNKIKGTFSKQVWICVSQEYSEDTLLREVLRNIGVYYMQDETVGELTSKLSIAVENKSFFLVLDDVWKQEAWTDLLRIPLNTTSTTIVLVTTRNDTVALAIGVEYVHRVELMSDDVGWELL